MLVDECAVFWDEAFLRNIIFAKLFNLLNCCVYVIESDCILSSWPTEPLPCTSSVPLNFWDSFGAAKNVLGILEPRYWAVLCNTNNT